MCRARDCWMGVLGLRSVQQTTLQYLHTHRHSHTDQNRGLLCALLRDSTVFGMCDGANRAALLH